MTTTIPTGPKRPEPIRDAFKSVGTAIAFAGSVVGSIVGWGLLTEAQGDAVTGLLGAIPGVVALVTHVLTAFGVINAAEPKVTPNEDPRDGAGRKLVAARPETEAEKRVGEHRLR